MATKPSDAFTFSTDANFGSGPASGNPTKVNPPGWPSNLQGFIPGLKYIAEYRNKLFNVLGQWTGWLLAGSSAGAADAHIVETDASGGTAVVDLTVTGEATIAEADIDVMNAIDAQLVNLIETGVETPAAWTTNIDNFAPASDALTLRVSATSAIDLTGIVSGSIPGRRRRLINIGSNPITLKHNTTSTAAHQFLCQGAADKSLTAGGTAELWFDDDSTRWRVLSCS